MGGQGWRKRGGKSERESERRCQRKCFSRLGLAALIRGMRHEAEACGCHLSAAWHMYVQCHVSHQAHLRCESTEKSMPLRGTKHHVIMRPCDHFRQSAQWCMCGAAHTQVSRQRCSTHTGVAAAKMHGSKDQGQRHRRSRTAASKKKCSKTCRKLFCSVV